LAKQALHLAHGQHKKVQRHEPFSVLLVNLGLKTKMFAKGTRVSVAEPYTGEALVLLLLETAGVSLKPATCHMFQHEDKYLGHVVRPGQLPVNQKNIMSLAQALSSRKQTELKSLLCMCNVYWLFNKDYAHIAKPLTKLTGKNLPRVLPPLHSAHWAAFEYLEELLTLTPILALPRREGLFILDTDGCAVQVGCTFPQQQPTRAFS